MTCRLGFENLVKLRDKKSCNLTQVLDLSGHELGDRANKKLNNFLQRNIDYAADSDQEDNVLYSASEIALNENNECVMIGEMITDGTDNH